LCAIPVCGVCARFASESVYCEKCEQLSALSGTAEEKSSQQPPRPQSDGAMAGLLREEAEQQRSLPRNEPRNQVATQQRSEKIQIAVVLLCCVVIFYQIAQSIGSGGMLSQQQIIAQEQTRNQIEACMLVFWEIAMQFSNGQQPRPGLRCPDTEQPLQIARQDGDVIVRHPRPSALGVSDIYVRRSDPTPILVE